ncbi:hypothetical protein BDW62DRAFT_200652 [Aspergillus aurantiobrunneus]
MGIRWTPEANERLLLGVLAQLKGNHLDYKALAAFMGEGCTVSALHGHIFQLRRTAGIPADTVGTARSARPSSTKSKASASTPKKSKRAASPETPITQAKKRYCISDDDGEEGEEDEVKKEAKPNIKSEKLDEEKSKLSFVDLID